MSDSSIVVVSPEDDELFVRHNDVELSVRVCDVHWAKKFEWYDVTNKRFRSAFYAALRLLGLNVQTVKADIRLLNKASCLLGLTPGQVRGAYGLAKGIFGRHGKFLSSDSHSKADVDDSVKSLVCRLFDESNWLSVVESAMSAKAVLPEQVQLDEEFRWLRANLVGWPDFTKAPSGGAVNDWLILNDPEPNKALIDFVKLAWTKRMSPGDVKRKKVVFEEDVRESEEEVDVAAGVRDKDMADQLFGTESKVVDDSDE